MSFHLAKHQETARKDGARAFGVLRIKWSIHATPRKCQFTASLHMFDVLEPQKQRTYTHVVVITVARYWHRQHCFVDSLDLADCATQVTPSVSDRLTGALAPGYCRQTLLDTAPELFARVCSSPVAGSSETAFRDIFLFRPLASAPHSSQVHTKKDLKTVAHFAHVAVEVQL